MIRLRAFFVSVALLSVSLALAAEPVIEPSESTDRVVILISGAVYRGEVVELEPRSHLILRLASGAIRRFEWRDLRRVGGASTPGPQPAPKPRQPPAEKLSSREPIRASQTDERPAADKVREPNPSAGRYREHLSDAKVLEEVGQLSEALDEYREAYRQRPEPFLLYRMASIHDQLDHPRDALKLYRRYLNENPNLPEERQAEVATNIARLTLSLADSASNEPTRTRPENSARTQRASLGMMAVGISIWGTSYIATAIVAGLGLAGTQTSQFLNTYPSESVAKMQSTLGVLLIPVAGPIISSALAPAAEWAIPWIFLGAGSQIAGMAMTIAGGRTKQITPGSARARLAPWLSPATTGLALMGSF